jgi:hypothetical protein
LNGFLAAIGLLAAHALTINRRNSQAVPHRPPLVVAI